MRIFLLYASLVLVLGSSCGPAIVRCVTTLDVSKSGFSIEMIITKLQVLEYHILKTDVKMDDESNYTSCRSIPFKKTGIYQIQPEKPFKEPITVLCDQDYSSGGWTVIQHRFEGSVIFYRGWQEYKNGFGSLEGEFWLGLDSIHQLTASKPHELVILLEDYNGNKTYANYDRFEIGDEGQKYALKTLGVFSGTAGDSLGAQKGMKFTTLDADNDRWVKNCAVEFTGAWWYAACHESNLNGQYLRGDTDQYATGMVWKSFRGLYHSLKSSKMMIRPKEM
ncbi:ficolin-2-like [Anopheles ziemanni]|uniref:ficolin-2-like n=1 Tax=Anopheles coustani TaxID=139045 RepID=UPI00265B3DCC|nr:ficolin-2-like [Anopheles coustani]XP_058178564.1 ficolin-2-like [Anopheles ziemanni]